MSSKPNIPISYIQKAALLGLFVIMVIFIVALSSHSAQASHTTFAPGDVFAAVGDGKVHWYHSDGTLNQVLDTGLGGETTGMAFDAGGNLYVTNFDGGTVSKFDTSGNLIGTFGSGYSGAPESIVFDAEGNIYVGAVDGDNDVRKFDSSGTLLAKYDVKTDDRGSDWIDLAADQCTIYYTSEGHKLLRFDVCTNTQLDDFPTGPLTQAFALRVLGNGSVLVADSTAIQLLDKAGNNVRTYDASGEDGWFALNRDPDGTSFWSGDIENGNFYKFDIRSGDILLGPIHACDAEICLGGLAVFGELTEAIMPGAGITMDAFPKWLLWIPLLLLPLLGLFWWLRRRPAPRAGGRPVARPDNERPERNPEKPTPRRRGEDVTHGQPPPKRPSERN